MHKYLTLLNGGIVTVTLDITAPAYMDRLVSVLFEGVDISSILDKQTLTALSMEAEHAYGGDDQCDYAQSDRFQLGE